MFFTSLIGDGYGKVSDGTSSFWRGLLGAAGTSSAAGVRVTPESALGLPIIQNCNTLLSESLAQLPMEMYERKDGGQRVPATSHKLYHVLRYEPNPFQTPYERVELSQMSVGLRGNSYTLIDRDDDGQVRELWPLDTDKVTVLKGPDLLPYYKVDGISEPLPMRLVHHVRWHSHNGYVGLSPIQLHAETIGLALAARQYTGKSFANGATLSGVIERPKEVAAIKDQASINAIVDQWGAKYSGIDNAKKVALLQEGMSFKPVSMTNVDADLAALLNLSNADQARIYKIPLPMVNDLSEANYNTTEQLLIYFVMFALLPYAKRHEGAMMRDFLLRAERPRYFIEFNLSGLMRGDQKSRYEAYAIGRQWGWLSVNDIRRLENMPPVGGGDTYLQPLNMVAAAGAAPDPKNPAVRAQLEMQRAEIERMLTP